MIVYHGSSLVVDTPDIYHSITYKDMSEGLSDMHCRSDKYLAQELKIEYLQHK